MGEAYLQDLVVVMVAAAAATILCYRLKLPLVLGYLLAGFAVGPFTPVKLISEQSSIEALAELGVIFLMFSVGLEFNLRKLKKVGFVAVLGAALEIAFMLALGYATGRAFGWSPMDSIYLGAILSISSTMIIVKVLMEMGAIEREFAQVAFGILIIEDVLGIVLIAVLPGFATTGAFDVGVLAMAVGKVLLFVLITVSIWIVLVPRLIEWVSRFNAEEVLVITVVGLAFLAALAAHFVGFSLALGAFLMGAMIAESRAVRAVEHKVAPIRDLFASVFFVAVGMLIDPRLLVEHWALILVVSAVAIVGKVVSVSLSVMTAGYSGKDALRVGFSMAQIGEFSFIIAAIGIATATMSPEIYPIAVAVCAITTLVSPFLTRWSDPFVDRIGSKTPRWLIAAGDRYSALVATAKSAGGQAPHVPGQGRHANRVVIYAAWLLGLLVAAAYLSLWLATDVSRALTLGENVQRATGLLFLGLFALPLVVAFTTATEEWTREIAKMRALKPTRLARSTEHEMGPRLVARVIAAVASIVLLATAIRIAWGVHPFALPASWLTAVVLVTLALATAVFWRPLDRAYHWMEETLNVLLGHGADDEHPLHRVRSRYPFGVDAEEVTILPSSWASFSSLRDLALPEKTGVTLISITRTGTLLASPHPDTTLLPGDRIVIVGKRGQLQEAHRLLNARGTPNPRPEEAVVAREVRIPATSPVVGRTVTSTALGEATGARIAAIRRRDGTHAAPSANERILAGDHVVIVGSEAEVRRAKDHLRVRDEAQILARPVDRPLHLLPNRDPDV